MAITWQELTADERVALERAYRTGYYIRVNSAVSDMLILHELVTPDSGRTPVAIRITDKGRGVYENRPQPDGLNDFFAALATLAKMAERYGFKPSDEYPDFNTQSLLRRMDAETRHYNTRYDPVNVANRRLRLERAVAARAWVLHWAIEGARIDWQGGGVLWDLPQFRGYSHKNERGEATPPEVQR